VVKSDAAVGLCATCRHARVMRSDHGSVFYLCQLSKVDQRFPKYPTLPVRRCAGYEADASTPSERPEDTR